MLTIFYLSATAVPACDGMDPDLFVGPDGEGRADREAREIEAKAVCSGCPLMADCLDHAMRHPEVGVWGGTTDDDRRAIRLGRMAKRPDGLTGQQAARLDREERAWVLYCEGVPVTEIATRLGVTADTTYTYIRSQRRAHDHESEAGPDPEAEARVSPQAVPFGSPHSGREAVAVLTTNGLL